MGLNHFLQPIFWFFFLNIYHLAFAQTCGNGVIRAESLFPTATKDDCDVQEPIYCYQEIYEEYGFCLQLSPEANPFFTYPHPVLECSYQDVHVLLAEFTDEYFDKTFPPPEALGSLEAAFKRCSELQCSWVIQDYRGTTSSEANYHIIEEPSFQLVFEESDRVRSSDYPRVHSFFKPRCYRPDGSVVSQIEDLCAGMGPPPENTEFIVTFDKSEVVSGDINNHDQCKRACAGDDYCIEWTFYPKEQICRLERVAPDSNSGSDTPRCALEYKSERVFARGVESFTREDGYVINEEKILAVHATKTSNELNCFNYCATNPMCQEVAIVEMYCYLFAETGYRTADGEDPQEILYVKGKIFGEASACDYGWATPALHRYNSDQYGCEAMGMCHKLLRNEVPWCYLVRDEPPEPVEMDDGNTVIAQLESTAKLFTQNHLTTFYEMRSHQSSITDCRKRCYEDSCFSFVVQGGSVCQVAKDAFTITPTDSDNYLLGSSYTEFLRYPQDEPDPILPVEELCQDVGELSPNWELGSILFQPYKEETATTYEDCDEKCSEDCERFIFRPQEQKCLMFETKEALFQDLEANSPTPLDHGGQQCIVKPNNHGFFKPKSVHTIKDTNLPEPREEHFLPLDQRTGRNECWEYCSQLPWCQSVFIHDSDNRCMFYDHEVDNWEEDMFSSLLLFSGKVYADDDYCARGGLMTTTWVNLVAPFEGVCPFFHACVKPVTKGLYTFYFCFLKREPVPEPVRINSICEVQPTFTSRNVLKFPKVLLEEWFQDIFPNITTYEDCVRICALNELCLGLAFAPTLKQCSLLLVPNFTLKLKQTNLLDFRRLNDDVYDDFEEYQVAFDVPSCPQCIQRVVMQEQIVHKDEIQCSHTLQESCSDVYKTVFKTQEVEECKESFVKNCHIEYEMVPRTEKIEVCHSPLARNCNEEGPETCSTEYETVCATTYHENEVTDDVANCTTVKEDVCDPKGENCRKVPKQICRVESVASKKLTPETDCRQEAREVCGPEICPIVRGERICADELKTFVQEVPQEKCEISPKTICDTIHKVVPKLEMTEECIDVPQEICETVQVEAERVKIPIVKEWCSSDMETEDMSDESQEITGGGSQAMRRGGDAGGRGAGGGSEAESSSKSGHRSGSGESELRIGSVSESQESQEIAGSRFEKTTGFPPSLLEELAIVKRRSGWN